MMITTRRGTGSQQTGHGLCVRQMDSLAKPSTDHRRLWTRMYVIGGDERGPEPDDLGWAFEDLPVIQANFSV
jgi:hypothetical protein